jgi:hypothetical protein
MNKKRHKDERPAPADVDAEELEEEQHAIELPAREAFSVVFSSPTFLQAGEVVEDVVLPDEPAPDVAPPA